MNTAYNTNTTTVQDARNRYNALLAQALERIKARKADKTAQSEEVTTTEQPEPVATPENVTTEPTEASKPEQVTATVPSKTRRTKTASPKPLGRDIYHIFPDKYNKWTTMLDSGVYHDPEGYALLSDNQILIGSELDYNSARSGELVKEDGTLADGRMNDLASLLKVRLTDGAVYTIDPDTITKKIKEIRDEAKYKKAREIFGDDLSISELKEELKYNRDASRQANNAAKYSYVELVLPQIGKVYTSKENIDRLVKVSKWLALSELRIKENKIQFEGGAGFVLACVCTEDPVYSAESLFIKIDLTDAMIPTGEDATPAPADTTAIEEATPVTAPQATEEVTTEDDTTTAPEATAETPVQEPEDVTTEESPEMTVEQEDDNAPVLRYFIERGGNACANYLDTLNYTQATERVYREKRGARTKVTERYYTKKDGTLYGLYRSYTRNGKRATFVVVKDRRLTERRTYGKNNNSYKADIQYNGVKIVYNVTDGLVTRAELTRDDNTISVVFDDTNRPETPRDLPAPAPSKPTSKETAKEAPATTVQEQPNSKPDLTPETTTVPEEVKEVTTSKQEDDTVPYWLLLDNELRAQQDEQEPATPEKYEDEPEKPMHAPQMLKKMIEEHKKRIKDGTATESIYNADALQTEVLTPKRAKELLGDDASDYKTYILVDGKHLVETNRPTLKKTLYIDDESKEYKEYLRGNISKVELYRDDMMSMYGSKGKIKDVEENPATLTVDGTKDKVLSFNLYRRADYGYRKANPDEVEIYKAAMRANHEAFSKRLDSYLKRYGSKIYVHSYWANR